MYIPNPIEKKGEGKELRFKCMDFFSVCASASLWRREREGAMFRAHGIIKSAFLSVYRLFRANEGAFNFSDDIYELSLNNSAL